MAKIDYPWLTRWGRGKPRATIDVLGRLDSETQQFVYAVADENGIRLDPDLTIRNLQVFEILENRGRLGLVLQFLLNVGMNASEIGNEFGMGAVDMKKTLSDYGVHRCFRHRRKSSSDAFVALSQVLDGLGVAHETGRRLTYTYGGRKYSVFPTFLLQDIPVVIFLKDTKSTSKVGRQDKGLRERGYRVLRFVPNDVLGEPTRVAFDIETAIQSVKISEDSKEKRVETYVIAVPKK